MLDRKPPIDILLRIFCATDLKIEGSKKVFCVRYKDALKFQYAFVLCYVVNIMDDPQIIPFCAKKSKKSILVVAVLTRLEGRVYEPAMQLPKTYKKDQQAI